MALACLGIARSQSDLAYQLGVVLDYGAPASRIARLSTSQIEVIYRTEGRLSDITGWLVQGVPVIAFIQTSHLTYWKGHIAQHAVVVVGIDEHGIYLHDPASTVSGVTTPVEEFLLAWDDMALAYAVLYGRQGKGRLTTASAGIL